MPGGQGIRSCQVCVVVIVYTYERFRHIFYAKIRVLGT